MNIPNDKGHPWRLNKFVEYQHFAPAVDPLTYVEYAKLNKLNRDQCVLLAWYHSLTYCEITAAYLFETFYPGQNTEEYWKANKYKMVFGSARKYVRNMDWFVPLMDRFVSEITYDGKPEPYRWLKEVMGKVQPTERFKNIERVLVKWPFMGRFSIDLFTEAIVSMCSADLFGFEIKSPLEYDWKKTSNLTSGLMNIFYRDEEANIFDQSGIIPKNVPLDDMLQEVIKAVNIAYPDQKVDTMSVINKICSFRNLFKKARYGGFHHDRQLENLNYYRRVLPEYDDLWEHLFEIRESIFPRHMLGEYNGWDGIRKERKKLWVEKGLTGVEF